MPHLPKKYYPILLAIFAVSVFVGMQIPKVPISPKVNKNLAMPTVPPGSPTPAPTPTPTPTPKPLTFAEMNQLYGPCTRLPVIFYHHIADPDIAKAGGFSGLNVVPATFRAQMEYLKSKGYTTVSPAALINFFDAGTPVPGKAILVTFDDGYADFMTGALPVLRELGFRATMFLPTGLVNNPGYLTWGQVQEAAGSGIYFANHTWSHKSVAVSRAVDEREITTAETQLVEHGLDPNKVFAYPYGTTADYADDILTSNGFKLAFTTKPGSTQCAKQRLTLPRIRIGGSPLSGYGL